MMKGGDVILDKEESQRVTPERECRVQNSSDLVSVVLCSSTLFDWIRLDQIRSDGNFIVPLGRSLYEIAVPATQHKTQCLKK